MSTPASSLNFSPERCCELPAPAVPNDSEPGLALAAAIRSFTLFIGCSALTSSTFGTLPMKKTGAKSFVAS